MLAKKYTLRTLFAGRPESLKLYRVVNAAIKFIGPIRRKVTKTQVSFGTSTNFAYVWLPQMWVKKRPETSVTLAFDLGKRVRDRRIAEAALARPGRWVHHVVIEKPSDVDGKVKKWLREAYEFGKINRRKKS